MNQNYYYTADFRDKLAKKIKAPIAKDSKTTFADLNEYDRLARESLRDKERRRIKREKEIKFRKKALLYSGVGLLALAFVCCQVKQHNEEERRREEEGIITVVGHNGEVYDIYEDGTRVKGGK